MNFTIHLDGQEGPAQLLRLTDAIRVLGGLPPISGEQILPSVESICEHFKVERPAGRMAGEGPAPVGDVGPAKVGVVATTAEFAALADEDAPVDPAALLAAYHAGGDVPLPQGATDAPSTADAGASTTAPGGAEGTSPTLDKDGLPWDERIHSGSRNLNKDGTWRRRSKLPDGVYEAVEADLRKQYPAPVANVPPPPPPPPPVVGDPNALTFAKLVQRIHEAKSAGTLRQEVLAETLQNLGVNGLEALGKRPDLFQTAVERLGV